ncbi:hypothetical protein BDQ17DRAFT_1356744 [Cyathus striatus]|nr:hypothetical protein BDQ17DRAFT_1356744 [Cyathus striatus]
MAKLTSSQFIQFCLQYSSLALLYYDYFLTLGREIKYIWFGKIRLSTLLYVFCRYAMVANVIFALALTNKLPSMSCNAAYQLSSALSVLGRAAIMLVWGMRTYAVFGRSRIVVAIFGTLGLFVFILAALHVPHVACKGGSDNPIATNLLSAFTVVFEVLLTVFTTFRGIQALRAGGPWKNQRDGVVFMILEQGLLYFIFVTGFTTTALVLNYAASPASFLKKLLNGLTIPISGLMTARFLLHLREWEGRRLATLADVRTGAELETVQFSRTVRPRQERSLLDSLTDDFGEDPTTSYPQETSTNRD